MQRPRRTSEFTEEPATATKRSRPTALSSNVGVSPAPSTAKKYMTRQSRIALPTRQLSLERNSVGLLNVPGILTSVTKRRISPKKSTTPSTTEKFQTSRVLFTAEKNRCTTSGVSVPLHTDKKWIAEKTQQINEYLVSVASDIDLNADFLTRGLRQMSIKQFINIINYFLHFIGNRSYIVVHVDDIIEISKKIGYPNQVKKSWLKTPTTQHSFGHVILLLDFLLDFVPMKYIINESKNYFQLEGADSLHELTSNCSVDEMRLLDVEIHKKILNDAQEGFMFWDKGLTKDFDNLQLNTSNKIILKRCNLTNEQIEQEVNKLKMKLNELEKQKIPDTKSNEEQLNEFINKYEINKEKINKLKNELEKNVNRKENLDNEKDNKMKSITNLEQEIKKLKSQINKQLWSIEEYQKKLFEFDDLNYKYKSSEKTTNALKEESYKKQVELSRTKRKLTDQVENFNKYLSLIANSKIYEDSSNKKLQLPPNVNQTAIKQIITRLQVIKQKIQTRLDADRNQLKILEQNNTKIIKEINLYRETKCKATEQKYSTICAKIKELEKEKLEKQNEVENSLQQCNDLLNFDEIVITKLNESIKNLHLEIKTAKENNETLMISIEKEHEKYLNVREEIYTEYATKTDELKTLLEEIKCNNLDK